MTTILPILNTETLVSRSFTSSSESQTSNNNQHNINYITNTVYPPILVIGTKFDLLSSHSRRSVNKFTSRFNLSTSPYIQNELPSAGNYHPCVPMTPRSCISSVQFFGNTTPSTTTSLSSSSTSWNLTYRNNYANGSVGDVREPTSSMPQSLSSSTQQSVYIDLSDSQKLSSSLLTSPTKDKTWNFATEHGFSEILLVSLCIYIYISNIWVLEFKDVFDLKNLNA